MKKVMLIFITSIFLASAVSAEVVGSVSLPVTLRLGDSDYIEVGFSRNAITSFNDEVEDISGETIPLVTVGEAAMRATPAEDIYLYWKIMSAKSLRADLTIKGSMLNPAGDELDWYVTLPETGLSIASNSYETSLSLMRSGRSFTDFGSTRIDIGTELLDAGDVVPGEYKGELRLSISVD